MEPITVSISAHSFEELQEKIEEQKYEYGDKGYELDNTDSFYDKRFYRSILLFKRMK